MLSKIKQFLSQGDLVQALLLINKALLLTQFNSVKDDRYTMLCFKAKLVLESSNSLQHLKEYKLILEEAIECEKNSHNRNRNPAFIKLVLLLCQEGSTEVNQLLKVINYIILSQLHPNRTQNMFIDFLEISYIINSLKTMKLL